MTNVWHRIASEDYGFHTPPTAEAEQDATTAVLKAARACKIFRNTATTPELKALIAAIEAFDQMGGQTTSVSDHPLHCPCPTCARTGA